MNEYRKDFIILPLVIKVEFRSLSLEGRANVSAGMTEPTCRPLDPLIMSLLEPY